MGKMTEQEVANEIEWLPKDFNSTTESTSQKLIRKCKESPFVPLGLLATIGALTYGLFNFYKDKKINQQYAMRARVTFQGLTIAAIAYSMYQESQRRMKAKEEESTKI